MKHITKGIVALAAGTALALSGAGTLAYWQSEAALPGVQFTTGDLSLYLNDERWKVNSTTFESDDDGPAREKMLAANLRLVPGSTVEWTQKYVFERTGDEMYLELEIELGGLSAHAAGNPDTPAPQLASAITASYSAPEALSEGGPTFEHVSGNVYRVTGAGTFSITATLNWPFGTADESNATEEKQLNLAASSVTMRQVAAPTVEPPV